MTAHVLDQDRMYAGRLVEVPARRETTVRELLGVDADGPDPGPVRGSLGDLGDARDEIRDRRDARIAHVDRRELGAGEGEVVVRVDEARQDRATVDVDLEGVRGRHRSHRGVTTDRDDPLADDRHAAVERRLTWSSREDASVDEDEPAHHGHLRTWGSRSNAPLRTALASRTTLGRWRSRLVPVAPGGYDAAVRVEELVRVARTSPRRRV